MFNSKKGEQIDQQIIQLTKQIEHINNYLTIIGSSANVRDRINGLKDYLSSLDDVILIKKEELSDCEEQISLRQEKIFTQTNKLDEKIATTAKMLEDYNKIKKKIKEKINKHLLLLHATESYISDYSKIYTSLSDRVLIDVCGEKILVTKFDGAKSPVIASIDVV